jgi:hypothetical protein
VRSGDLFGDLGQRRITRPGILEPVSDRDFPMSGIFHSVPPET